jgi:hypothetical protein
MPVFIEVFCHSGNLNCTYYRKKLFGNQIVLSATPEPQLAEFVKIAK